jgi:hypothetical protein
MKHHHRFLGLLVGAGISALLTALTVIWSLHLPVTSARAAPLLSEKPVSGWYVCQDLGIGSVPGVPDLRQRFQLCHDEGWIVNTYCTQPGLPVPPLGRSCTRIGEEKYSCGTNNQLLRKYQILSTPVDTATPVDTPTPNATPTQTITPPPVIATETPTNTPTSILSTQTETITPTSILSTQTQTITPPPVRATETQTITPPPVTATQKRPPRPPTGGEGNAAQVRTLIFTEISIFTLAMCIGIWFLKRLEKRG